MAKKQRKEKLNESISLEFDSGGTNSPEKFLSNARAFLNLVKEVGNQLAGTDDAIDFDVQVYPSSIGIKAIPLVRRDIQLPDSLEHVIIVGIQLLENNSDQIPLYFTIKALNDAQILSKNAMQRKHTDGKLQFVGQSQGAVPLSSQTNATVERLIGKKYVAHGSIEGELRMLKDTDDKGVTFQVLDELNEEWIDCEASEEWEPKLLTFWKKRVSVLGTVSYDKTGFPISIKIENINELPKFESLPPVETYRGLFVS